MDAEHLEYFKAALEGRASVGWNVWFAANHTTTEPPCTVALEVQQTG